MEPLSKQALSGLGILAVLYEDIDGLAVLADGSPEEPTLTLS
jgi:hypothetical protein